MDNMEGGQGANLKVNVIPNYVPVPGQSRNQSHQSHLFFNLNDSANELLRCCLTESATDLKRIQNFAIVDGNVGPPPKPDVILTAEQLTPSTVSVPVVAPAQAFDVRLLYVCCDHPIVVIRGMTSALGFNLDLFSTQTLLEAHPNHEVDLRIQPKAQQVKENGDPAWLFISRDKKSTVSDYAKYQSSRMSLRNSNFSPITVNNALSSAESRSKATSSRRDQNIEVCTDLDLADPIKWKAQQEELLKLPYWLHVAHNADMLKYAVLKLFGINTPQAYLKVPGARTPGHQENNNFCSVNISIGPDDCEWFGVPFSYWGCVQRLCAKNNVNFLHGSWWPNLKDLRNEGIPVYNFLQKKGDIVWVNSGCVHWVESKGFCNNISWNVGPLSPRQYQLAIERYEWNKVERFRSMVPMIHLTWNLVQHAVVHDVALFVLMRNVMMRTLVHTIRILEFVKAKGLEVKYQVKVPRSRVYYCCECLVELFNILLLPGRAGKPRCFDCALKKNPNLLGFQCVEEWRLPELFRIYDAFTH